MDLVKAFFVLSAFGMTAIGLLYNLFEAHLPNLLSESFMYGRLIAHKNKSTLSVPKSWFLHFYVLATTVMGFTSYVTIRMYVFEVPPPSWILGILRCLGALGEETTVSYVAATLATLLFTLHVAKRLYETHFVSVFSETGKMNIWHYSCGIVHYLFCAAAIFGQAPSLHAISAQKSSVGLGILDILATVTFIWARCHQHKSFVILGDLRKDRRGSVVSSEHKVPYGDWFEYVSCAPQLAEVIVYVCLAVILRNNSTWWWVVVWVIANQVETSLQGHWWYLRTFKDYPKNRKAIIPYIL